MDGSEKTAAWFSKARDWKQHELTLSHLRGMVLWAGVAGVAGALVVAGFREAMSFFELLLMGSRSDFVAAAEQMPAWRRVLTPVIGGCLAGLVMQFGMRLVKKERARTDYMEAFIVGDGHLSVRASLVKGFCSLFSICSGGSMGREGAMVQLSAMVSSSLCRLLAFPVSQRRTLVACGAAAGLASAYNAPLAATVFVSEIVVGSISFEILAPIMVSAVIANATTHDLLGYAPVFSIPDFHQASNPELLFFLLLGAAAGRLAPCYLWVLKTASQAFQRLPGPLFSHFALGGLGLGIISLASPQVWGNGHSVLTSILNQPWTVQALLLLFVLKVLATAMTIGSGAVGGVFTPTLLVGASLGGAVGMGLERLAPELTGSAGGYALIGMGAFLSATTRAPFMAILMVFEMTRDYDMMLPLMLACTAANYVALPFGATMYTEALKRPKTGGLPDMSLLGALVPDAAVTVGHDETLEAIEHKLMMTTYNQIQVVDAEGRWLGVLARDTIGASAPETTAGQLVSPNSCCLTTSMNLHEALHAASESPSDLLPVVDKEARNLIGTISKSDLLALLEKSWR